MVSKKEKHMELYQRCILIAAGVAWCLFFWYLPEHFTYKQITVFLIRAASIMGLVLLVFVALTDGLPDKNPGKNLKKEKKG